MTPKAIKVLAKATELLGKRGKWVKGRIGDEAFDYEVGGPTGHLETYCAVGAVREAMVQTKVIKSWSSPDDLHTQGQVLNALEKTINEKYPGKFYSVPGFNDNHRTKHADVKDVFCTTLKRETRVKRGKKKLSRSRKSNSNR